MPAALAAAALPAAALPAAAAMAAAPPLAAGPPDVELRRWMLKAYNGIRPNGVTAPLFPGVHDLTGED